MFIANTSEDMQWYIVHTYSGYENKVKANLERVIENREMQDYFEDIIIPMMEEVEIKEGKEKTTLKKVFPGYVLIKMILTDETWYVVRNVRGVTGFVGPGSKPSPLTEQEVRNLGVEPSEVVMDYEIGDTVKITSGPLENFTGVVEDINTEKEKVKVLVSMFGREISAELEFRNIQKIY